MLVVIAICTFVAQADGKIARREQQMLEAKITDAPITHSERLRLRANLRWMLRVPPDLPLLRRRLEWVPPPTRREIGLMTLAVAAADGAFNSAEVGAVKRLYRAMDLPSECLKADLHSLQVHGDQPVTVRPRRDDPPGFGIPSQPREDTRIVLDPHRVANLLEDTDRVSALLGEIFQEDQMEDEEPRAAPDHSDSGQMSVAGLDWRHAALLRRLLERPRWENESLARIVARLDLMPSGSLEVLNEWAFDRFGDAVIVEYNGYEVNTDIGAALTGTESIDT